MTFNTGNPVGSTDARDLYDNAQNFDKLSIGPDPSYPDRLGVPRKSWAGMEADFAAFLAASGFEPDVLQYVDGAPLTVLRPTQLIERASTPGILYAIKLPSAFPVSLSGTWTADEPSLVIRADSSLRNDLESSTGAGRVGFDAGESYAAGTVGAELQNISGLVPQLQIIAAEYVRPQDFGAVGDGVVDDTAAVQSAVADGRPVYWGGTDKVYRITAGISHSLAKVLIWKSDGATVKVDAATNIQRAFDITAQGFSCFIEGVLTVDCNLKSFSGLYFYNAGAFCDFGARNLRVRNCYRNSTAFTGGDGIWVRGAFRSVYLERPDVRNVRMAAGAGVAGSQGIAGITISSAGVGLAPQEITIIHPYVDKVVSEDVAYTADQDGLRVFTEEDTPGVPDLFEGHYTVIGGAFRNCGGRSIKSQMELGTIIGTKFIRNGTEEPLVNRTGGFPEIDFQVGGGSVENVEFLYRNAAPSRFLGLNGTRQAGKYAFGWRVSGVKGYSSGGTLLSRFAALAVYAQEHLPVDISDVHVRAPGIGMPYFLSVSADSDVTGKEAYINLTNVRAPVDNGSTAAFVFRVGATYLVPMYVSGRNLVRSTGTANANFVGSTAAGSITSNLSGVNVRVA